MPKNIKKNWPKLGIIVVHYGSIQETLDLLKSLNKLTYSNAEVYLVDNDPRYVLPKKLPKIKYKTHHTLSHQNLGWAGGANLGLKLATTDNCEVVTFMTSDLLVVDPEYLQKLVKPILEKNAVVTLPMVVYASNPNKIWMIGGRLNEWWLQATHNYLNASITQLPSKILADYGGIGTTISTRQINKVSGWSTSYFLYYEDVDLYYKLRANNVLPYLVPEARIAHATSSVSEKTNKKMELISAFCYGRAGMLFIYFHFKGLKCLTAALGQILFRMPIFIGGMILQQHWAAIPAFLHGFWSGSMILVGYEPLKHNQKTMELYRKQK